MGGEEIEGFQDGLMLDRGGNYVPFAGLFAVFAQAKDGEVITFGGATGEDNVLALRFDQSGDLVAGFLDGLFGASAEFMGAAAGVTELLFDVAEELALDLGVNGGGGVAVEVNRHGCMLNKKSLLKC